MATDSAKARYYSTSKHQLPTSLVPLEDLIDIACQPKGSEQ
ncbi:MAG: hypothetical protein Kow0088_27150 [Anaerolineales bacterium]